MFHLLTKITGISPSLHSSWNPQTYFMKSDHETKSLNSTGLLFTHRLQGKCTTPPSSASSGCLKVARHVFPIGLHAAAAADRASWSDQRPRAPQSQRQRNIFSHAACIFRSQLGSTNKKKNLSPSRREIPGSDVTDPVSHSWVLPRDNTQESKCAAKYLLGFIFN